MKKTKTKKSTKSSKLRLKHYSPQYLAAILTCVLILEGILLGVGSGADWQRAVTILDTSNGVSQTAQDMTETLQPVTDLVQGVDQFYQLSADAMMQLLDLSDSGIGSEALFIFSGVNDFYQQSSIEMTGLLGASVAGALIQR